MTEAAAARALKAEHGYIRGDHLIVTISHPPGFSDWGSVAIELRLVSDEDRSVRAADVPRESPGDLETTFRLPRPSGILGAVCVTAVSPSNGRAAIPQGDGYALGDLFPKDQDEEVPEALSRAKTVRDAETLGFVVSQIVAHGHHSLYTKTEAIKKLAFMSMQTGSVEDIERSIGLITEYLPAAEQFRGKRGKKHPTHLRVSFLFIRMLANLTSGRHEAALADMEALYDLRQKVRHVPLIASNLSRAVLIYAWVLAASGERSRAAVVFDAVIQMFRDAAAFMPARRQRPFLELNTALRSASQAIACQIALRDESRPWDKSVSAMNMAAAYSRLEGREGQSRLALELAAAAETIRAARGAGRGSAEVDPLLDSSSRKCIEGAQ